MFDKSRQPWRSPMLPLLPETPLDCAAISSTELVELVAAAERLAAQACAVQAAAMAELARRPVYEGGTLERPATDRVEAADLVAAEVGAACRWSRMMAQHRVRLAIDLAERLPATLAALAAGTIDLGRARAVAEATLLLDRPAAAAVEGRVLDCAADQTVSQLKVALRRAVIAVDPLAAAARHEAGRGRPTGRGSLAGRRRGRVGRPVACGPCPGRVPTTDRDCQGRVTRLS